MKEIIRTLKPYIPEEPAAAGKGTSWGGPISALVSE